MFAKNKVTQSMLDAVNSVLVEDGKKRLINDAEVDETGFHKAAHAAKKANQSHFEFQGKKYPVTAKSHKEAIEMDEANSEKVKTATGMKVYGHRYGNAAKAHRDQTKSSVDDIHKGPSKSDIEKTGKDDDLEYKRTAPSTKKQYATHAGKYFSAMDKGDHRKTDKEAPRYKNEEYTFAAKLLNHITENKASGATETFTDNNLGEEDMTDKQMKKREKIVLSMKKGEAGFKQRYGKNWKNVMYATATKQAMKAEASDTWNGSYDFILNEKEEVELDEGDAQYKKTTPTKPMSDVVDRKKTVKDLMKGPKYFGTGKMKKEEVELNEDNLDSIAKKHDMEFKRTTYGAGMKHKTKGEVSINRYGEWHHYPSGSKSSKAHGNSEGNFSSLDKHLSSLKEEVEIEEAEALVENFNIINEVSVGAKIRAYAQHKRDSFDHSDMGNDDESENHDQKADKIMAHIEKHHGSEAAKHAHKLANSMVFGRHDIGSKTSPGKDSLQGGLRRNLDKGVTKSGKIGKSTQKAMKGSYMAKRTITGPKGKLPEEVELEEAVATTQDKSAGKNTTDMLVGRVPGGKLNSFKSYKVNLTTNGEDDIPKEMDKGEDTKEKQKITTSPGSVDVKLDDKYGNPTPQSHFATQEKITKEEVELTEGALEKFLSQKGIEMKNLSYSSKIAYSKSNEFVKWKQNHQMESAEPPFDKPYKTAKEPVTTDKSGAKHTPHSRAKDLARQALKKLKGETMMGKISN